MLLKDDFKKVSKCALKLLLDSMKVLLILPVCQFFKICAFYKILRDG